MDEIPRLYCNLGDDPGSVEFTPPVNYEKLHCLTRAREESRVNTSQSSTCENNLGPWLRKTMRFRGTLTLSSVNLRCFPFDVHVLPLRLKASRCRSVVFGCTLDGTPHRDRVHLIDNGRVLRDEEYRAAQPKLRGHGHHALFTAGNGLQEFDICHVSGGHWDVDSKMDRSDIYQVNIVIRRPLQSNHCWDLVTMNLLVMLAATSLWDTSSSNLSSRMTITLMVILSLVAFTSSRPAPIAKAPYITFHDWCEQICIFLVTGISIQNVAAVVLCGGESDDAPEYMAEVFESNASQCNVSWCFSRSIDCRAVLLLATVWLGLTIYSFIWLVRMRQNVTRGLHDQFLDLDS